jgi:hypothetical protein
MATKGKAQRFHVPLALVLLKAFHKKNQKERHLKEEKH